MNKHLGTLLRGCQYNDPYGTSIAVKPASCQIDRGWLHGLRLPRALSYLPSSLSPTFGPETTFQRLSSPCVSPVRSSRGSLATAHARPLEYSSTSITLSYGHIPLTRTTYICMMHAPDRVILRIAYCRYIPPIHRGCLYNTWKLFWDTRYTGREGTLTTRPCPPPCIHSVQVLDLSCPRSYTP